MSVKFQIIALKFPLSHSDEQIKEFVSENDRFVYKQSLHKKDAEHNILFQKKKFQKIDANSTIIMDYENENKKCILILNKASPDFQTTKMKQRGGEGKGRPKKEAKQEIKKACLTCIEGCIHVKDE